MDVAKRLAIKVHSRVLLGLAALIWLLVGMSLIIKGGQILAWQPLWLLSALAVGLLKAFLLLDRLARRNVLRLHAYKTPIFIGRLFAARTWIIIAVMIVLGRLLRLPGVAPQLSGFFSLAVGLALVVASRLLWQGWFEGPPRP